MHKALKFEKLHVVVEKKSSFQSGTPLDKLMFQNIKAILAYIIKEQTFV